MSAAPPAAVTTLAIIKVNWDRRLDYIGNFLPLAAHCIREGDADEVSLPEVQARIWETFGIRIPGGALKTILHRAARQKLLHREDGVFHRDQDALDEFDLSTARERVLREHANLVSRLKDFAKAEFNRTWSDEQAESALLSYIEALAVPILRGAAGGEQDLAELPSVEEHGSVVVSKFVLDLRTKEPEGFAYLETIVKGTMLTNVLYWPETFNGGKPRLTELELFLDTPFLLIALGFAVEEMRSPALELIEILHRQGARLKVFRHTLVEAEGVLAAAADQYRHGGAGNFPGDVVHFFVEEGLSQSDVELMIARKDRKFDELEMEVVETPDHQEELSLDERGIEAQLMEGVGYGRRETLLRDLDSLTAIHRLRGGELCTRIETCGAVLVTTNSSLVRTAATIFEDAYEGRGTPLCVLDSTFTAIVWLMDPLETGDLPRKQMIATSYAALSPPEGVWRRYLDEVGRLQARGEISEEDVALAKYTSAARGELMRLTLGDASAYVEGTVQQVLARARQEARADVERALAHSDSLRAAAERDRDTAIAERERAEAAKEEARQHAETVRLAHANRRRLVADRLARFLGAGSLGLLAMLVVIGAALATEGLFPDDWTRAIPFALPLLVLAVILGLANSIWGLSVAAIAKKVEHATRPRIYDLLTRILAPEDRR